MWVAFWNNGWAPHPSNVNLFFMCTMDFAFLVSSRTYHEVCYRYKLVAPMCIVHQDQNINKLFYRYPQLVKPLFIVSHFIWIIHTYLSMLVILQPIFCYTYRVQTIIITSPNGIRKEAKMSCKTKMYYI